MHVFVDYVTIATNVDELLIFFAADHEFPYVESSLRYRRESAARLAAGQILARTKNRGKNFLQKFISSMDGWTCKKYRHKAMAEKKDKKTIPYT